ncbi:MAG: Uma2 family endonuclease [Dehalococcoidia bacterium]
MTIPKKLLTAEDFWCLPSSDGRTELIDGEVMETMPPGGEHNYIMGELTIRLGSYVRTNGLGVVLPGDTGIILARDPDRVRGPDLCFIARDRLPGGKVPRGYLEMIPDLIVEIVSPNDRAAEIQAKTEEWLRAGARLVWAMYPTTRTVVAAQGLGAVRVYHESDTVTGDPVLPGFTLPVAELFASCSGDAVTLPHGRHSRYAVTGS